MRPKTHHLPSTPPREKGKEGVEVFFKVLTKTNFEKFGYS
jgi:hypothetical protein